MRIILGLLLASSLASSLALGNDDQVTQLWLDHAVAQSDYVVRGRYEGGRLDVLSQHKGKLPAAAVAIDRNEVEARPDELVPGTPHMKGDGVFFLQRRFDGAGADARRFIEW